MQNRMIFLTLVLGAFVFGGFGFLPSAHAIDYAVSDEQSCKALPADTSWDQNTCTLDSLLFLTADDELIVNWGVIFDVSSQGNLQIGGPVQNLGTIIFSGDSNVFRSIIVDNIGTLIIQSGSTLTNSGELSGTGEIENFGILKIEKGGTISSLGDFNNFGTIENKFRGNIESDTFNHFSGAYLNNTGTIDFTFSNIDGVIDNYNGMTYAEGLTTIGPLGVINNIGLKGQIDFDQRAIVDILGKLDNFEDAIIFHGGIINIQFSGNFSNSGWLELGQTAVINNFGLLQNNEVGDVCTFDDCEEPYNGVIDFLSDEDNPFEIFAVVNNDGTFHNFDTIWNSCGKINDSLSPESIPPIDDCELIVGILSPSEGASFTDSSVIPFLGFAIDKDELGKDENFGDNLIWTNKSNDVIGTGAGFPLTISRLGTHIITATESVSGTSFSVKFKIGFLDVDGDGASPDPPKPSVPFDCDDNNPLRFVGNPEVPDGIDNDCVDRGPVFDVLGVPLTEIDNDLDGYIEDEDFDIDSWFGDSSVVGGSDCDDGDANRSPGLNEINDGVDNDCTETEFDDGIPFYETDDDEDGFAEYEGDCQDVGINAVFRNFHLEEVNDGIDNDCDGTIANIEFDHDGDGYIEGKILSDHHIDGPLVGGGDCLDAYEIHEGEPYFGVDPVTVNPGILEIEDGIDNDCDGTVDSGNNDADGDGHFTNVEPYTTGWDCNDSDPDRFFGNSEIIDGLDNDCSAIEFDDGLLDEERDVDGDGYIYGPLTFDEFDEDGICPDGFKPLEDESACILWNDNNHTPLGDHDCDDDNGLRFLTNPEVNDGIDNDCVDRGPVFDVLGVPLTEIDNDLDGYTEDPFDPNFDVNVDLGVIGGGDCNDDNKTVYPEAPELDDGILNDCLGSLPGDESDDDGDGQSEIQGDCDDTNSNRFLDNPEIVDGIDNDCVDRGPVFDVLGVPLTEIDNDLDGYIEDEDFDIDSWFGDSSVVGGSDCDDSNESIFPGNSELDNGQDDNCNFAVDEGFDLDEDGFTPGFGSDCLDTPIESESDPRFGKVATILTTNIDSATVNQDRPELLNHVDDDCDGIIDNVSDKFTSPEFQENLDEKTIRDYEKMMEKLSHENEKLEEKNEKLEEKAAREQEKINKEQAKVPPNQEKADEHLEHQDKALAEMSSNESLIDINERQIHVIDVSINNAVIDERTLLLTYSNLTDKAFEDILHDIEKNFKEIEKLEEKAAREQEKINKEQAKVPPNQEKADEHLRHKLQAESEILIIEDLNQILKCAIDFSPELLEKDKPGKHDKVENLTLEILFHGPGIITNVVDKFENVIVSSNTNTISVKASNFDENKFDSKIYVTSGGATEKIHVSCSQPLFIGQTFGEYVIFNLLTTNGNNSCGGHDD